MTSSTPIAAPARPLRGQNRNRVRADHGQPARGHVSAGRAGASQHGRAGGRASSSTGCSSAPARISTAIRAPSSADCDKLRGSRLRPGVRAGRARSCIPVPQTFSVSRPVRPAATRGRGPSGTFQRRGDRGAEAVQPGAAARRGVRQEGLPAADDRVARMVRQFNLPIEIVAHDTVREPTAWRCLRATATFRRPSGARRRA